MQVISEEDNSTAQNHEMLIFMRKPRSMIWLVNGDNAYWNNADPGNSIR